MTDKAHIVEVLRGQPQVDCIDKKTFTVQLKTPVTLKLKKNGIHTDTLRVIPYTEGISYINGLLGIKRGKKKWDDEEHKRRTAVLAKLYHNRLLKVKDYSFKIDDKKNPSIVYVSNTGVVRIVWSRYDGSKEDRPENVYDYDDCVQGLTRTGFRFVSNLEYTAQATMEEIERHPVLMAKLLGPGHPQPPNISIEAIQAARYAKEPVMSDKKQFWHHEESNSVFTTKEDSNIQPIIDMGSTEIDKKQYKKLLKKGKVTELKKPPTPPPATKKKAGKKAAKPKGERKPRGKGLGVGGKALNAKERKAAEKAIKEIKQQGKQIRCLITDHDADNDTIMELLDLADDKPVQRTRRAILREAKNQE